MFSVDGGRFLQEEISEPQPAMIFLGDVEEICNALKDNSSCWANDKCSWCVSAAVPSACHSLENTKYLPPPNFNCDPVLPGEEKVEIVKNLKIGDIVPPIQEVKEQPKIEEYIKNIETLKDQEASCNVRKEESTCVMDFVCGWCADGCHSIEVAQNDSTCEMPLPPPQPDLFK